MRRATLRCLAILVTLAIGYTVLYAKPVLLPVVLALLLTLVLRPVHQMLCRLRMPTPLAAGVSVLALVGVLFGAVYFFASPASTWAQTLDMDVAEKRIESFFQPVQEVKESLEEVADRVDQIGRGEVATDPRVLESVEEGLGIGGETEVSDFDVTVTQTSVARSEIEADSVEVQFTEVARDTVLDYAQELGLHIAATLLLIFFFLAYGDVLYRRVIETGDTEDVFEAVSDDVSSYLFTITLINICLGVCVAIGMWALGMPNPILWGGMAALLNFIPYLGALSGTVIVTLVAVISFSSLSEVLLVPIIYYGLTSLEGNVITPMVIGKRFSLNPIIVVLAFLAWGSIWGIAGMLIATPTLMGFKIVCQSLPSLARVDRIISR